MAIRVVTAEDEAALAGCLEAAAISLEGRRGGRGLLETWLGPADPSEALERLRSHLGPIVARGWILGDGDGMAMAWQAPDAGWLAVWVSEASRNRGAGSELAGAALAWLAEQGSTTIDSLALPGDRQMKNLLERAGFKARLLTLRREG